MRDVLVLAIILGATPICFYNAYFGILMWTWVAYFNPHRFCWGMAHNFPVALLIGGATIAGTVFTNKEANRRVMNATTILLLLMWAWLCISTWNASMDLTLAHHLNDSITELIRISKILFMTFITIRLITSKEKLRYLFLVTAFSFAFFAIKGALFVWNTNGQYRVYGPPDSFIEDNNALGLALNMSLPLFYYLARTETNKWVKRIMHLAFYTGIVSVLLTYSRGALLGLSAVLLCLSLRSKHKVVAGFLLVICAWGILTFAPAKWMDRMGNFFHGNLDNSAELRLNAWHFAYVLAKHYPLTGGGLKTFTPELYQIYTPELVFAGPHSIYFQMLGESGFVGLALFLGILFTTLFNLWRMRRQARYIPSAAWIIPYTYILETGLYGYMISGAFLELAHFDLFYQVIASAVIMKILLRQEMVKATQPVEEGVPSAGAVQLAPV